MLSLNPFSRSLRLVALVALIAAVSCSQVLNPGTVAASDHHQDIQAYEEVQLPLLRSRELAEQVHHEGDTHEGDNHTATTHEEHDAHDEHGDGHEGHSELSVHVTYEDIYAILLFLLVATGAGIVFEFLGMPALVGEICTGFLLGPPLADFVPYPEAMVLVGEIGLILLLLEAGVEIDVGQLQQTGTRAITIAGTGSLLPLLVGFGIATAAGESWKGALAVGAAFSPTSLAVAGKALGAGGMLNTPVGQLIVASCVIDDTIALIILAMFQVLVAEDPAIWEFFIPIISAVGFLIVLGGAAIFFWPKFIENTILPKFKEKYREMVMFSIMAVLLLLYLPLLNYTRASYLSGAFLAGMSFSQIHSAHDAFIKNTHQLMIWLLRVFFAASIGFQIPIKKFGDPAVIGWGFALYACVAMKFPLGFYVPRFHDVPKGASFQPGQRDFIVTGLAMSCRGEFSFIIASFGLSSGLIGESLYSAVVWAVLISCVTSPFMLLKTIKYYKKQQVEYMESMNPMLNKDSRTSDGKMNLHLHIHITSRAQWGMQEKFREKMSELGLEVIEHTNTHERGVDALVDTNIYVRDSHTQVDLPTIQKQRKDLRTLVQSSRKLMRSRRSLRSLGDLSESESNPDLKRPSSRDLMAMADLEANDMNDASSKTLHSLRDERIVIENREREIQEAMREIIHQEEATVSVEEWNPWDWTNALQTLAEKNGGKLTRDFFMDLFDMIDADGGGTVDEDELYEALVKAGLKIARSSLSTMIAMVDDNNDGEVDREEWAAAIDFFLEQRNAQNSMMAGAMPDRRSMMGPPKEPRHTHTRGRSAPLSPSIEDDETEIIEFESDSKSDSPGGLIGIDLDAFSESMKSIGSSFDC